MKRAAAVVGILLMVLLLVVLVRTALFRPRADDVPAVPPASIRPGAAERLAASLSFRTISHEDSAAFDPAAFQALHRHLRTSFPRAHSDLDQETVGAYSLIYRWTGSDSAAKPIAVIGHMDVVPVEPGTEQHWTHPPFSGRIAEGFIWGRGAIDNKSTVMATLEAVEMLLEQGFRPARTIYLIFGHDEEVGGTRGARRAAEVLTARGVRFEMVLDEGSVIGDGILPGVASPVALLGVAEKGFVTVELSVSGTGGHSSLPPPRSAIGILAAAVDRLEHEQLPARLPAGSPTRALFETLGPHFPIGQRIAFANLWLTRPLVLNTLEKGAATNAMIRTTTAVTIFEAGTKENVLPSVARAVVNFRILQGDSSASVIEHVRATVDDPRVSVRRAGAFVAEPSRVSRTASEGFRRLARSIRAVFPGTLVAPYLVVVVTDSRHFADLTDDTFRFLPLTLSVPDLARMHGTDERISVAGYDQAIRFYRELIRASAAR